MNESSERSLPLSASRTYYPGFLAALFLVLLRIAIGWHFHTEGWEKIRSYRVGDKPFSAEIYLRNATGPLARYFRGMVPDVNGLEKLDPEKLKASWTADVQRIGDHYAFDSSQREKAAAALVDSKTFADTWFSDREMREKRAKYIHDLAEVQKIEWKPGAIEYEKKRAWERRKDLEADRKELVKDLDARGGALRQVVANLATPEQAASAGPVTPAWSQLDIMNTVVTYGVWMIGLGLILGLFTRLSALAGAAFLLNIYLCIPPWPGLPESPRWEGHYYIVDKNSIEMLACLALACLPTGHWVGLDALLFGRYARARAARREEAALEMEHADERGRRVRVAR